MVWISVSFETCTGLACFSIRRSKSLLHISLKTLKVDSSYFKWCITVILKGFIFTWIPLLLFSVFISYEELRKTRYERTIWLCQRPSLNRAKIKTHKVGTPWLPPKRFHALFKVVYGTIIILHTTTCWWTVLATLFEFFFPVELSEKTQKVPLSVASAKPAAPRPIIWSSLALSFAEQRLSSRSY